MTYLNLKNAFISRHIQHQHWYICSIALPVHRNPLNSSLLTVVSVTSAPPFPRLSSPKRLPPSCEPLYATNTSYRKQETFLYEYLLHWGLLPIKMHKRTLFFVSTLKHCRHFDYWNQNAHLLPRLPWSWAVLLPSDTHRKPITSITAVLFPFVNYLLIRLSLVDQHQLLLLIENFVNRVDTGPTNCFPERLLPPAATPWCCGGLRCV
jgi:hypothetical protein